MFVEEFLGFPAAETQHLGELALRNVLEAVLLEDDGFEEAAGDVGVGSQCSGNLFRKFDGHSHTTIIPS